MFSIALRLLFNPFVLPVLAFGIGWGGGYLKGHVQGTTGQELRRVIDINRINSEAEIRVQEALRNADEISRAPAVPAELGKLCQSDSGCRIGTD